MSTKRTILRRKMKALGVFKARRHALLAPPVLDGEERQRGARIKRAEGPLNFPYGARPGASPSILNVHERGARQSLSGSITVPPLDYEQMTRDELRALAKHKGLTGYGKMNKAELVAAVSA